MNITDAASTLRLPEYDQLPDHLFLFMHLRATRAWLDLDTPSRRAFFRNTLQPLLSQTPQITLRYFDTEAFNADVSDLILWQTTSLASWSWLCDQLRDTLFWDHYFTVTQILPALEFNLQTLASPSL